MSLGEEVSSQDSKTSSDLGEKRKEDNLKEREGVILREVRLSNYPSIPVPGPGSQGLQAPGAGEGGNGEGVLPKTSGIHESQSTLELARGGCWTFLIRERPRIHFPRLAFSWQSSFV